MSSIQGTAERVVTLAKETDLALSVDSGTPSRGVSEASFTAIGCAEVCSSALVPLGRKTRNTPDAWAPVRLEHLSLTLRSPSAS